jgi:ribosomal protein S16
VTVRERLGFYGPLQEGWEVLVDDEEVFVYRIPSGVVVTRSIETFVFWRNRL